MEAGPGPGETRLDASREESSEDQGVDGETVGVTEDGSTEGGENTVTVVDPGHLPEDDEGVCVTLLLGGPDFPTGGVRGKEGTCGYQRYSRGRRRGLRTKTTKGSWLRNVPPEHRESVRCRDSVWVP